MDEPCIGRVLLTNDDGIDAPGMEVLEEVAPNPAREVWVVAPEHDQSGTSHSISLHAPLRLSARGSGASAWPARRATAWSWACGT